jgi:RNA 2',3'-cyclic 3'-phosphodiesterase
VRLFIAADLEDDLRRRVAAVPERVRLRGFRLVAPEALHVTVRFLGDIEEARVVEIARALASACAAHAPFAVELKGGGTFGAPRRPRVAWIGIADEGGRLAALAASVAQALAAVGFAPAEHAFSPHLTIGRAKARASLDEAALAALPSLGWMPIAELVLFRSETRPAGAVHTALARAPLGAAPGGGRAAP